MINDDNKIVVRKGEKYKLFCCTHDLNSEVEEIFVADYDLTQADLDAEAQLYYINEKQPEWYGCKVYEDSDE